MFPWDYVDGLWVTKSEGVGLIDRAISFQDFQPMWSWSTSVTDRRTDRRTTCNLNTALCSSASRGNYSAVWLFSRNCVINSMFSVFSVMDWLIDAVWCCLRCLPCYDVLRVAKAADCVCPAPNKVYCRCICIYNWFRLLCSWGRARKRSAGT